MKKFIFIFLVFSLFSAFANEHVKVIGKSELEYHDHKTYEVWYDTTLHNPSFVIWDLTIDWVIERLDGLKWAIEIAPSENNYKDSSFDRGHMCPNADMDFDEENSNNTFRTCNICPQTPNLNRGEWKRVEKEERKLAKEHGLITIVCGPIYAKEPQKIGKDGIAIPKAFFKVFIWDGEIQVAYVFSNKKSENKKQQVQNIEDITGLKFNVLKN